jgi:phosphatidylserine synthase
VPLIQHDDTFFSSVQITINAHASVSYMLAALGINVVPTMPMIYLVFASLVCMTFVSVPFLPPAKMKWNRMPIFGALFVFFLSSWSRRKVLSHILSMLLFPIYKKSARVMQQPPVRHECWMVGGQETLINHGG